MNRRHPSPLGRILAVARKETVDMFRDRRSMVVILVTAIAAGTLLLMLVMNLVASQMEKRRELTLAATGLEHAPALVAFLERQQVTLVPAPAEYERQVRAGDLDIAMEVDPDFAKDVAEGRPGKVSLVYDRSRDRARAVIGEVESLLRAYSSEWACCRLHRFTTWRKRSTTRSPRRSGWCATCPTLPDPISGCSPTRSSSTAIGCPRATAHNSASTPTRSLRRPA